MDRRQFLTAATAAVIGMPSRVCAVSSAAPNEIAGELRQLTKVGAGDNRATYMPDGRTLLFASRRTGKSQLWTMDLASGRSKLLSPSTANDYGRVAPNPAGTQLCFSSDRSGENAVYVLDLASGRTNLISDKAFWSFGPTWSAHDLVAFFSRKGGNALNVWTVRPDGSVPSQVTNQPGESRQPWWSPDGSTLALSLDRGTGVFQIWLTAADGSTARAITSNGTYQQPFWSPDGKRIAVSAKIDEPRYRIYVMNADGSDRRPLRQPDDVDNVHPAWSPDGHSIVFTSGRAEGGSLYVFNMS
jgi:TolB protein